MEEIKGLVNAAIIPLAITAAAFAATAAIAYKTEKTKLFNSTRKITAKIIATIIALMIIESIGINLYSKVTDPQFLSPKKTTEKK